MKNAFRQMYSTLSDRFVPNKGGVVGYVDRIWRKYHAKWGMQMTGMIFQTRSSTGTKQVSPNFNSCSDAVLAV